MGFQDHFSGHARTYGEFRPDYPVSLFAYLADLAPGHELAWDCATGNGQAALGLAEHFRDVLATDASPQQIEQARPHPRVLYAVAPSDRSPAADASVDLVTVAQALHWFDLPAFYAEVRRVLRPGGVLAVWCYGLHVITPEVDAVVHRLYHEIVGNDWPLERRWVEESYRTVPFPFDEIAPPCFQMTREWNLRHLWGYLDTWSACRRYQARTGVNPLDLVRDDLGAAWGDPNDGVREVRWPLSLRIGRLSDGQGTASDPERNRACLAEAEPMEAGEPHS